MGKYLTAEELKELLELYQKSRSTPVVALSVADGLAGNDFANIAHCRFEERWAEIAMAHGVSSSAGFNSDTGEIIV